MTTQPSPPARPGRVLAAAAFIASLTAACVLSYSGGLDGWWDGWGPVVPHETFPADCTLCHTSSDWNTMREDFEFDHLAETGFALVGAHAEAQCLRCHNDRGPVQEFARQGCAGCHGDVHERRLGDRCLDCHTEDSWRPFGQLAEHARTRFPLFGAHATVTCDRCHVGIGTGSMEPLSVACESCHQADLQVAVPDHFQEGWITDCGRCHRPTSWAAEGFVHDFFPLTGGHQTECASCHANEVFAPVSDDCNDCHQASFTLSTNLDHVAFDLPRDCDRCHGTQGWLPSDFDHSVTLRDCSDCHLPDYFATQDPDHSLWGYGQDCRPCHGTEQWRPVNFGHPGITQDCNQCHFQDYLMTSDPDHQVWGYPTSCEDCHGQFTAFPPADFGHVGVVNGCVQCHFQDYLGTTDPNHVEGGFPLECELCHEPDITWDLGLLNPPSLGDALRQPPAPEVKPEGNSRRARPGQRPRPAAPDGGQD